jgi:hypothetical protein
MMAARDGFRHGELESTGQEAGQRARTGRETHTGWRRGKEVSGLKTASAVMAGSRIERRRQGRCDAGRCREFCHGSEEAQSRTWAHGL